MRRGIIHGNRQTTYAAAMTVRKRWIIILIATLLALLLGGFAALQFAIHSLKGQVEKTLGPQGEVKEIRVNLTGVEIIGLRNQGAAF